MLQMFVMKLTHKDQLVDAWWGIVSEKFAYYELPFKGKAYIKKETLYFVHGFQGRNTNDTNDTKSISQIKCHRRLLAVDK